MLTVTVDKIDGSDITNDIRLIDPAMIVGGSIRPITANTAGSACIMEVLTWDGNIQNYRAVRWTLTDTFTTILRALDYSQVTLVSVDGETVTTDLRAIDQSMLVAGSMRPKTANNTATAAVFKVLKWDNNTFTRIAEEWEVSETFAALKTAFITESASIPYGSTSGTDTYTVTASPALTEYIAGATVRFKVGNQNTGASTLNVNGLGAKSLVKGVSTALAAANLLAGGVYTAVYDGTNFQVKEVSTSSGGSTITYLQLGGSSIINRTITLVGGTYSLTPTDFANITANTHVILNYYAAGVGVAGDNYSVDIVAGTRIDIFSYDTAGTVPVATDDSQLKITVFNVA
jgi:hypothetical protein